ncbi:MAG: hypothetical protein M0P27_05720, partial [Bacteroidales bacterium]|nr:hypothetical protein [Bacteroidales bacterium]
SFVRVMYNQDLVSQYPNVLDFLVRKKYDLKEKILVPDRIEFISPNVVKFYYSSDIQRVVNGSYTQSDSYVTIVNDNFPFGISAATNNIKLEIYYPTNYILNQLYSLLTVQDDPQEYFSYVIVNADGVGVYTKSSSGK